MKDPFSRPLANLRHLYQQMCQGAVKNTAAAAKGLLGPAIVDIEKIQEELTVAETSRQADENFVAAYLAWKADPTSRRRNHMIRRRRELIHASSTVARLAH